MKPLKFHQNAKNNAKYKHFCNMAPTVDLDCSWASGYRCRGARLADVVMVQIYGAQTLAFDSGKAGSQRGVSLMCDLRPLQLFRGVIYLNTHPSLSQVHPDPGLLGATTKHLFHKTDRGREKERERVRDDNPGLFITAQTRRSDMNRSEHKCVCSRVVCHSEHYLECF